jgi:hypothetical protein
VSERLVHSFLWRGRVRDGEPFRVRARGYRPRTVYYAESKEARHAPDCDCGNPKDYNRVRCSECREIEESSHGQA